MLPRPLSLLPPLLTTRLTTLLQPRLPPRLSCEYNPVEQWARFLKNVNKYRISRSIFSFNSEILGHPKKFWKNLDRNYQIRRLDVLGSQNLSNFLLY